MNRHVLPALLVVSALLGFAGSVAADVIDGVPVRIPGYHVRVVSRLRVGGSVLVNLRTQPPIAHGVTAGPSYANYTIVDDAPIELPERLCAVPAEWVIEPGTPGGARSLRGATVPSGTPVTGAEAVASLMGLFEAPEVACARAFAAPGPDEPAWSGHAVDEVTDAVRVVSVHGRVMELSTVEVTYQLASGSRVTLPVEAGATTRPALPPASGGCGCRATSSAGAGSAWSLAVALLGLLIARRSLARRMTAARGTR